MLKKLIEGFLFGCGFTVAFVAISALATYYVWPRILTTPMNVAELESSGEYPVYSPAPPLSQISNEEKIGESSAIAIAKYQEAADGRMEAIITEFLKVDPDIAIHYEIGDEFTQSSYYPENGTSYGEGVVIFFTGSPARIRSSMTFSRGRVPSLGDITLSQLREMIEKHNKALKNDAWKAAHFSAALCKKTVIHLGDKEIVNA